MVQMSCSGPLNTCWMVSVSWYSWCSCCAVGSDQPQAADVAYAPVQAGVPEDIWRWSLIPKECLHVLPQGIALMMLFRSMGGASQRICSGR